MSGFIFKIYKDDGAIATGIAFDGSRFVFEGESGEVRTAPANASIFGVGCTGICWSVEPLDECCRDGRPLAEACSETASKQLLINGIPAMTFLGHES